MASGCTRAAREVPLHSWAIYEWPRRCLSFSFFSLIGTRQQADEIRGVRLGAEQVDTWTATASERESQLEIVRKRDDIPTLILPPPLPSRPLAFYSLTRLHVCTYAHSVSLALCCRSPLASTPGLTSLHLRRSRYPRSSFRALPRPGMLPTPCPRTRSSSRT